MCHVYCYELNTGSNGRVHDLDRSLGPVSNLYIKAVTIGNNGDSLRGLTTTATQLIATAVRGDCYS